MARFGLLLAIGLVAGCHPLPLAPASRPAPAPLPPTTRGTIEPDVSAVSIDPAASPPARPTQYRQLTAAECRILAIKNAPLADDLDTHPDNETPSCSLFKKRPELAAQSRLVRGYAADELRNRSAHDALELYFKLAAAEGQFDLLTKAHGILHSQLVMAENAIKVGAADRADAERLRRQLLDLESQLAKLEAAIAVLNAGLGGQLGLDPADTTPLWPADPLRVRGDDPDAVQAVQIALRCRPDLNMLRTLAADEDHGGALANSVLNGINPLLGTSSPTSPLMLVLASMKKDPKNSEAKLHRQLVGALQTRERQAEAEVRAAVATVRGNRAAVAAKAAEVKNLTAKVADLEKREAAGQPVIAELTTARIDLLKLRGELVQSVTDWHISDAKLRQTTGMLVRE